MGFFQNLLVNKFRLQVKNDRHGSITNQRQINRFEDISCCTEPVVDLNSYPLKDAPIPVICTDEIVRSQGELIHTIKRSIPLTNDQCDSFLFPVIYNLAELVHLIPASSFHHHKGRGGLFRHSLEVGLFCVNMAKTHMFGYGQSAEENFRNNGRWYLACCIAGLLHDAGKVLTSVTISGNRGRCIWYPLSEPLTCWAHREGIKNYNIAWNTGADSYDLHMLATPLFFAKLVDQPTRTFLQESNSLLLISELIKALSGVSETQALITNLVKKADARSTQLDIESQNTGKISLGVNFPIVSIVEGIVLSLIEKGAWKANHFDQSGTLLSPLLVTNKGVFLYWKKAHQDIVRELDLRRADSIPRSYDILAEKLCEGGLCEFSSDEDAKKMFWKVVPAATVEGVDPEDAKVLEPQIFKSEEEMLSDAEKKILNAELAAEMQGEPDDYDGVLEGVVEDTDSVEEENENRIVEFNFLSCLKISEQTNLFVSVSTPASTFALVKGLPVSSEEARRWMQLTRAVVPMTAIDPEERELIREAQEAKQNEDESTVFVDDGFFAQSSIGFSGFEAEPFDQVTADDSDKFSDHPPLLKEKIQGEEKPSLDPLSSPSLVPYAEQTALEDKKLVTSKENDKDNLKKIEIEKLEKEEKLNSRSPQTESKRRRKSKKKELVSDDDDFCATQAGKRAERKQLPKEEKIKPSKQELIFNVLQKGLIKQLKAGKGPMLANIVLEDGERKTSDEVIRKALASEKPSIPMDSFIEYLKCRQTNPLLRYDETTNQFCFSISE